MAGDRCEPIEGDQTAGAAGAAWVADLFPQLGQGQAVQGGQPLDVGPGGLVVRGWDGDRQPGVHHAEASAAARAAGGLGGVAWGRARWARSAA